MNRTQLVGGLLICALLFACSPKNTGEKAHGVLTDTQTKTLDKAKKTEEVLNKASQERMKEADDVTVDK